MRYLFSNLCADYVITVKILNRFTWQHLEQANPYLPNKQPSIKADLWDFMHDIYVLVIPKAEIFSQYIALISCPLSIAHNNPVPSHHKGEPSVSTTRAALPFIGHMGKNSIMNYSRLSFNKILLSIRHGIVTSKHLRRNTAKHLAYVPLLSDHDTVMIALSFNELRCVISLNSILFSLFNPSARPFLLCI